MKIDSGELLLKAREFRHSHQVSSAKVKRMEWTQSCFNSIAYGNINIFSHLMQLQIADPELQGLDIHSMYRAKFKETILHSLCRNQRILMLLHFLVNKTGDPNQLAEDSGMSSLHVAVMKAGYSDDLGVVRTLLDHGADILKKTRDGANVSQLYSLVDPEGLNTAGQWIADTYRQEFSLQYKVLLYLVIHSEARHKQPFCHLDEFMLQQLLQLI